MCSSENFDFFTQSSFVQRNSTGRCLRKTRTLHSSYKNGRQHRYYGGLIKQSPYRVPVPSSGSWHVTVDMAGLSGTTRSSIRVLPGALPEARSLPLASAPSLVQRDAPPGFDTTPRTYDVFISHASEDKDDVVRPLAIALQRENLKVWYDEFELRIGDSLRRKIDQGLANSRVGLVVLSQSFISKGWTNYELDGIVTKSVSGEQVLLPIWHNISKQQVIAFSPSLADKVARNTLTHTVEEIAKEIAELLATGPR
ncbi:MAG: DUF1883 domain-containing protein [Gammaproteobacteria bacterium]|nr:DUF1883 domain-containing protein [Gammaproteobacteria bacterium]